MTAIIVNDVNINTELKGKALATVVGGRGRGRNPQTGEPIKIKARSEVKISWGVSSMSYFRT